MQTGTKISGGAHLVLLGVAMLGGAFRSEPLPFEVHDVSVITAEEFAALSAPRQQPQVAEQPAALVQPDAAETETPELAVPSDQAPDQAVPTPAVQPAEEAEPETIPDQPRPDADVSDSAPALQPPEPEVTALPESAVPSPQPRPVDRVAPQPVAPPPPDATPDEVETPEVSPDEGTETPRDPQQATAPEEATDRIITEADQTQSLAPASSPRPPSRPPVRPAAQPEPPAGTATAVDDALAEALGGAAPAAAVPTGPPMTAGEKESLRVAVSNCWNVGSLSSAALQTTVVVGVTMKKDGKPENGSIRLLSSSGGSDQAARQAFEAARRAIIRCGAKGYDLPADKYNRWRDIEMTFNPERMRIK